MKYIIIGCRKCGTTSLEKYMKEKWHADVIRWEQLFTRIDGVAEYEAKYSDRKPVIILRDPVERTWSDFQYQHKMKQEGLPKDLAGACKEHRYDPVMGERGVLLQSQYALWIKAWKKFDPIIYHLEAIREEEGFPHEWENPHKAKMTDLDRMLIRSYL